MLPPRHVGEEPVVSPSSRSASPREAGVPARRSNSRTPEPPRLSRDTRTPTCTLCPNGMSDGCNRTNNCRSSLPRGALTEAVASVTRPSKRTVDRLVIRALAESLAVRYPNEPNGERSWGSALLWSGDFAGAITPSILHGNSRLSEDWRCPGWRLYLSKNGFRSFKTR